MAESVGPVPKVTVAIPFYNALSTLPDAVRSVFAQTFSDWELLLIDDGSTDGSGDFARALDDPRIRFVADGRNEGLASRLNQAHELARGEFIVRMDADDVMHPARLERQLELLERSPEIELVCSAAVSIDSANRILGLRGAAPLVATAGDVLKQGWYLLHPTVTGRRGWFERNPYSLDYPRAEDLELWTRGDATAVTRLDPTPLLFLREGFSGPVAYSQSRRSNRALTSQRGPRLVGRRAALRLNLTSYVKEAIYRGLSLLRIESVVLRARYQPFGTEEAAMHAGVLERVLAFPLPLRDSEGARKAQAANG